MKKTREQVLELLPKTKESGLYLNDIPARAAIGWLMEGKDPYSVIQP